jgi:hypothetical protein
MGIITNKSSIVLLLVCAVSATGCLGNGTRAKGKKRALSQAASCRPQAPNRSSIVAAVMAEKPEFVSRSCQENGGTWELMNEILRRLRAEDARFGFNIKRGNQGRSHDAIAYYVGADLAAAEGSDQVRIIDIIGGHCGNNPGPSWNDVTDATLDSGTIGRFTLQEYTGAAAGEGANTPTSLAAEGECAGGGGGTPGPTSTTGTGGAPRPRYAPVAIPPTPQSKEAGAGQVSNFIPNPTALPCPRDANGVDGLDVCTPWEFDRCDSYGYYRARTCDPNYACRIADANGPDTDLNPYRPGPSVSIRCESTEDGNGWGPIMTPIR